MKRPGSSRAPRVQTSLDCPRKAVIFSLGRPTAPQRAASLKPARGVLGVGYRDDAVLRSSHGRTLGRLPACPVAA